VFLIALRPYVTYRSPVANALGAYNSAVRFALTPSADHLGFHFRTQFMAAVATLSSWAMSLGSTISRASAQGFRTATSFMAHEDAFRLVSLDNLASQLVGAAEAWVCPREWVQAYAEDEHASCELVTVEGEQVWVCKFA